DIVCFGFDDMDNPLTINSPNPDPGAQFYFLLIGLAEAGEKTKKATRKGNCTVPFWCRFIIAKKMAKKKRLTKEPPELGRLLLC
ncbi:MAG: hypothetical protein ACON4P_08630, partial [Candidatus Puniceispirillales bacterium]